MALQLKWWDYILMALSVFIGSLFLNFFVKKINEARLEERFIRLQKKNSTNRATQVQESFPLEQTLLKDNQLIHSDNPGISSLNNKEENHQNNRDINSNSRESKESSHLKFLGDIYDTKESVLIETDNNIDKKTIIPTEIKSSHVQNNDLKEWISDLIVNNFYNVII